MWEVFEERQNELCYVLSNLTSGGARVAQLRVFGADLLRNIGGHLKDLMNGCTVVSI